MTISEFIYGFDDGSAYPEYDEQGNVYIYDNTYDTMMAQLVIDSSVWEVEDYGFVMSSSLLRLMAELADTPPEKRRVIPKYVILNGLPRCGMCYYFSVDCDEGQLITGCVSGESIEECASFSKERLCEAKKALPPELSAAVDMMTTVTLERAIELTEKSRDDDLD